MSTVLITGGHSGIGLGCSRQLAADHHDLLLAGRSPERMRQVAEELRATCGVTVDTVPLDTSSSESVRSAAATCRAMLEDGRTSPLQAVVCNAGGRFDGPVAYGADGHELTFATNCLGHFLLVELLQPHLAQDGRIVFTASGTHDPDTLDGRLVGAAAEPDAVALARTGRNGATPLSAGRRYSTSKLCTVMYAYELARRLARSGSAQAAIAFDPGSVAGTGFVRTMPAPVRAAVNSAFSVWLQKRLGVTTGTVEFSGSSLASIAVDPAYAHGSGKYFQVNDGTLAERRSSTVSYDQRRAAKLWDDSKDLVHLRDDEEPAALR